MMVYPGKCLSSCLVEAGFALSMRMPSVFMVRNRRDLPYGFRRWLRDGATFTCSNTEIPKIF